jgi:hypothetical protein
VLKVLLKEFIAAHKNAYVKIVADIDVAHGAVDGISRFSYIYF